MLKPKFIFYYCLCTFFLLGFFVRAQNQTNIWYFGIGAGVDFNSGTPTGLNNGQTAIPECSGSACDVNGNLLFYTDGLSVWDKNHNLMPNGTGLAGGADATQLLIVPDPGNCSRYYIFHVQDHLAPSTNNLSYSIVDMCLNGGNGDVLSTSKNVFLNSPCGEKITAVMHANGTDVWIVSHKLGNNEFIAYQLSPTGITGPVSTYLGANHAMNHMIGPIRASHDGSKICIANTFGWLCELYDFDNATGVLSNFINLYNVSSVNGRVYGIEFSPNDNFLYIATTFNNNDLFQIDLSNFSTTTIHSTGQSGYVIGALQSAPDGKIYLARNNQSALDVINSPDLAGMACSFVLSGLTLPSPAVSRMGLPNFVPAVIQQPSPHFVDFLGADTMISACSSQSLVLKAPDVCNSAFLWSDGLTTDSFVVSAPGGSVIVQVSNVCGDYSDTIQVTFNGSQSTVAISSLASSICAGDSVALVASGNMTINWLPPVPSSQQQNDTVWVAPQDSTIYTLVGTDSCGSDTTVFMLPVYDQPDATFTFYQEPCSGTFSFYAQEPLGNTFDWDLGNGSIISGPYSEIKFGYQSSGTYTVQLTASNGTCSSSSSQTVVSGIDGIILSLSVPVPNIFSPNGDGINDSLVMPNLYCVNFNGEVYDRWGLKVFETDDFQHHGWDGKGMPDGVYYVIIYIEGKFYRNQYVQLIR